MGWGRRAKPVAFVGEGVAARRGFPRGKVQAPGWQSPSTLGAARRQATRPWLLEVSTASDHAGSRGRNDSANLLKSAAARSVREVSAASAPSTSARLYDVPRNQRCGRRSVGELLRKP